MKTYQYKLILFCSVFLLFVNVLPGQTMQLEMQELVFPQMAVGGDWESELTLISQGAEASSGRIYFYDEEGLPMQVIVNGSALTSERTYHVENKGSRTFTLTLNEGARSGWILVSSLNYTNRGSVGGILTYRYKPGGVLKSQVGIPASRAVSRAQLPFDNTNGNHTAMALAMLDTSGSVEFTWYDEDGEFQDSETVPFEASFQTALYIDQLFPESANTRGVLKVYGSAPFNMAALNDNLQNYSSTPALAGVFERELTLIVPGDNLTYTLKVAREGHFFTGIVESFAQGYALYNPVSGTIMDLSSGGKYLQLTFVGPAYEGGASCLLTARVPDDSLRDVTGDMRIIYEDDESYQDIEGVFTIDELPDAPF